MVIFQDHSHPPMRTVYRVKRIYVQTKQNARKIDSDTKENHAERAWRECGLSKCYTKSSKGLWGETSGIYPLRWRVHTIPRPALAMAIPNAEVTPPTPRTRAPLFIGV